MVSCDLVGGAGNQMFQIAAGYSLALDNDDEFACYLESPDEWAAKECHHRHPHSSPRDLANNLFRNIKELPDRIEPNHCDVTMVYNKIPYKKDICLHGWFQSEKHFAHNRKKILELFKMSDEDRQYIEYNYPEIISSETVSVHIRRRDYLSGGMHQPCTIEYYQQALQHFPNAKVIVFSDDIEWCKENGSPDYTYIEGETPHIDMYMMSMCDHNIIANSTFSWWGAWLNENPNKRVIAPEIWLVGMHVSDIVPENWITLLPTTRAGTRSAPTLKQLQTSVRCTSTNVVHFMSYGDENFAQSKARIAKEAAATKWFDTIKVYGPEDVEQYKESFSRVYELSEENKTLGFGRPAGDYRIWKILLLRQRLSEISDGEFLVYADAGCTVHKGGEEKFKQYLQLLTESEYGAMSFQMTELPEKEWTTKQLLRYFNVKEDNHDVLDSGQMHGTFIVLQKNKHSTRVLHECFKCLLHDCTLITDIYNNDQADYFKDNRHDQSILSLACKMYGSVVITDTAALSPGPHHEHPFWGSRITC